MSSNEDEQEKMLKQLEEGSKKTPTPKFSMVKWLDYMVGNDILELFGKTGFGKSKICSQIAIELSKEGKSVTYYDSELSLSKKGVRALERNTGVTYKSNPDYEQMIKIDLDKIKTDYLIIDSTTLYITGRWAFSDMHKRGHMLQMLQWLYNKVKVWCQKKKKTAIFVAQPISEMGERNEIAPIGDKANFFCKTILKIKAKRNKNTEKIENRRIVVFKSRDHPDGTVVSHFKTTATGVIFDQKEQMMKIATETN
jgi:RecA/RadA recombinase|tara:strand:+ start:12832 stop:13590 length:759 start_codon:yes stop_codon:yes gene_type:complete